MIPEVQSTQIKRQDGREPVLNISSDAGLWGHHFPDSLTEPVIDRLIAEAEQEVMVVAEPTSALLDGSALERRRRRTQRRLVGVVLRSVLPPDCWPCVATCREVVA